MSAEAYSEFVSNSDKYPKMVNKKRNRELVWDRALLSWVLINSRNQRIVISPHSEVVEAYLEKYPNNRDWEVE